MAVRPIIAALLLAASAAAVHVTVIAERGQLLAAEPELRLQSLDAEHLADIYARVGRGVPLIAENDLALPVRDVFAAGNGAVMVEISQRVGPFSQASGAVFRADGESGVMFPARRALSVLSERNIAVSTAEVAEDAAEAELQVLVDAASGDSLHYVQLNHLDTLKDKYGVHSREYHQHTRAIYKKIVELSKVKPVIVVEHGEQQPAAHAMSGRRLLTSSSTNATAPTEEQIADYQITLWTAVGLFFSFFVVAYLVGAMHIEPDSLLYAKFQSARAQSKRD